MTSTFARDAIVGLPPVTDAEIERILQERAAAAVSDELERDEQQRAHRAPEYDFYVRAHSPPDVSGVVSFGPADASASTGSSPPVPTSDLEVREALFTGLKRLFHVCVAEHRVGDRLRRARAARMAREEATRAAVGQPTGATVLPPWAHNPFRASMVRFTFTEAPTASAPPAATVADTVSSVAATGGRGYIAYLLRNFSLSLPRPLRQPFWAQVQHYGEGQAFPPFSVSVRADATEELRVYRRGRGDGVPAASAQDSAAGLSAVVDDPDVHQPPITLETYASAALPRVLLPPGGDATRRSLCRGPVAFLPPVAAMNDVRQATQAAAAVPESSGWAAAAGAARPAVFGRSRDAGGGFDNATHAPTTLLAMTGGQPRVLQKGCVADILSDGESDADEETRQWVVSERMRVGETKFRCAAKHKPAWVPHIPMEEGSVQDAGTERQPSDGSVVEREAEPTDMLDVFISRFATL